MKPLTAARALFAALFVAVTYLTVTTNPDDTKAGFDLFDWIAGALLGAPQYGDKLAHFSAYAALGFMSGVARLRILDRAWPVLAGLGLWGVILEGVQRLGGVRHADALDAAANASGVAGGFALFLLLVFFMRRGVRA